MATKGGLRSDAVGTAGLPDTIRGKLIVVSAVRFEPGYWQGFRQPVVQITLQLTRLEVSASSVRHFDQVVTAVGASRPPEPSGTLIASAVARHPVLGRVLHFALNLLEKMGMPVMGGATALKPDPANNPRQWIVGLPAISEEIGAPQAAFGLACELMNQLAAGNRISANAVSDHINKLVSRFRKMAPAGVNSLRFLQAAHEMGIPWRHVANNVYQFGWGSRSRWLDSSFTDETSTISASLARDKVASAKVLRAIGLPVPRHQLVGSAEQAVKVADALGYPVVVKPANLDGGLGVMAGLRDAQAVVKAFALTAKYSKRILVEQFVEGEDYRIRICTCEVIGAVIRKAAAVVGDGMKTVQALIDATNAERARSTRPLELGHEHGTKPIVVDEEVQSWLTAQGLTLDSIVPRGHKVRLRGAANVNLGGTTWDVTERAHPDNLKLALRAAAALRLDVAGVDLLLPDIGQSWKVTGGAICEVNGQPQFSSGDAHRKVLARLVKNQGRIPVIGIADKTFAEDVATRMTQEFRKNGQAIILATHTEQLRRALLNPDAEVVIWLIEPETSPGQAAPVDRLDLLIELAGISVQKQLAGLKVNATWAIDKTAEMAHLIERLRVFLQPVLIPKESR